MQDREGLAGATTRQAQALTPASPVLGPDIAPAPLQLAVQLLEECRFGEGVNRRMARQ